jgi:hypothetical protein
VLHTIPGDPNATAVPDSAPPPWRFSTTGAAVRVFLTCWVLYAAHFATNTVRELYPALSLGDHLTFDVSEYAGLHPDIFSLPGRGAFINNNPGASMVGAIPYALARPLIDRIVAHVQHTRAAMPAPAAPEYESIYPMAREFYRQTRERGLDIKFGLAAAVTQAFAMAPLSALSAALMFLVLASRIPSPRAAVALAFLYAVATPIFYRTAQLNHNVLVAHCAFFGFVLLWRPWDSAPPARGHYLLAGLLGGWAVVCDYSGLIVVAVLGGYAVVRWMANPPAARGAGDLGLFAGGVLVNTAILCAYQWYCFGNPWFPAQHYMPPAAFTALGYAGMDWPHADLLWETLFGLRYGLFTSAPLLLLGLYPPAWSARMRLVESREAWCIAIFCLLFLLFCSANQYGRMQFNTGVRHIVPVSAFLFLIVAGVMRRLPSAAAWAVGIATAYWSWCLAMYRDVEQGLGVFESVIHVTREGVRLPWLKVLQSMGYVHSQAPAGVLLLLFAGFVYALWGLGGRTTSGGRVLGTNHWPG